MQNNYRRVAALIALGIISSEPFSGPVQAEQQEELRTKVEQLDQEIKILKRQLELQKEASAEKAKTTPLLTAGAGGFSLQSADTNFVLKLRGYIQADSRFFLDDHSAGTANDTFLLRRVRPIFEGTVFEKFDYRLMLDFGSGVTSSAANDAYVQDAYFNAKLWPALNIQAGKFKEPVGLERLQSGGNLLFVERAYPTQLLPNRDVGVMVHGTLFENTLTYQLGAFNGVADGGSADIESSDDEKDIAARIFAEPFKSSDIEGLQGLGIGIAGTYGNREGAPRAYSTPGQQRFFAFRSGAGTAAAPNVVADGENWRISPQFYYYYGPFGLLGEYAISDQELRRDDGAATFGNIENRAWQVSASYFLTGEKNAFKAVNPRKPFALGGEGWGAWELTARVSGLEVDDAAFPVFASPASSANEALSWTAGFNWHLNRNFKVQVNYEQTDFDGGTSSLLQEGEQVLLTRGQISF
ncbi:MAG: porin [Verrucomicrobiota bacterium]|nr:porin [Verrucomicrobiota bacterium]